MILDLSNVNFPGITYTNISNNYELNPANWEIDNQDLRDVTTTANNLVGNP